MNSPEHYNFVIKTALDRHRALWIHQIDNYTKEKDEELSIPYLKGAYEHFPRYRSDLVKMKRPGLRACMRILQFPSDGRVDEMRLKLALSLGIPVVKIEVQVKVKGKIRVRVGMRDAVVKR